MKTLRMVLIVVLSAAALALAGCGAAVCEPGAKQNCSCGALEGSRLCKEDGSGFSICQCDGTSDGEKGTTRQEKLTDEPSQDASVGTEPASEPQAADEPAVGDEPDPTPDASDDAGPADSGPKDLPPAQCQSGEFAWQGKCYNAADFCQGNIQEPGFPQFTQDAQEGMKQPYELELDPITQKPLFCKTKDGYYYLSGSGYGKCDIDGDGWINIEAYRAVTSTDAMIQRNARCQLRKIKAIVYHAEGKQPQVQSLDKAAALVETFRNDGGSKPTDLPVYTKDQAPLPKSTARLCTGNIGCNNGEACYLGQCVAGRQFDPAEINTLTKACIANIDLNDNKIDDASESPSDTPDPANEFKPLLTAGYFIELHYGYFQAGYDDKGNKIDVYHIKERSRTASTDKQGLGLNCQEQADGFQPDYWRSCPLRDNQRCPDPKDPTVTRPGLSHCWLKDVQRLTPSLFKCVLFDNAVDKTQVSGFFHPDNYGFARNYNRSVCNAKGALNASDPMKRDVQIVCSQDDGKRGPDPSKQEVGWACVSFRSYKTKSEYLGSCVDQSTEQTCGTTKDGKPVTYFTLEKDSYGLTRAGAPCGQSNGKGECDAAVRICSGGTWLACNKCDNCPQTTAGQRATCKGGVWPAGSCKLLQGPSREICDGLDNDCDGQVDEGIVTTRYYKDDDKDGYGLTSSLLHRCPAQKPAGYVTLGGDCDDNNDKIKPGISDVCDGIDNDCDGKVDEDASTTSWYKDDDGDTYGDKSDTGFQACRKGNKTSGYSLCRGRGDCISIEYTNSSNQTRQYTQNHQDCCDKDKDVNPGQKGYFASKSSACSTANSDFWDYNCDGKATADPSIHLCNCSTKSYYREYGRAYCDYECKSAETWFSKSSCKSSSGYPCNHTSTNALYACQLDKTHTFSATRDYSGSCKRSCKIAGSGSISLSCSKSKLSGTNASSYTPKANDGNSSLIAMHSNQFGSKATCHFMLDGARPKCGQTTSTLSKSTKQSTPSYSDNNSGNSICSTSKTQCTSTKFWANCKYTHTVSYSPSYYYFKTTSIGTGVQVKCN